MSVVVILLLTLLYSIHQSSLHPDYVELGFYFLLNLCFAILIEFVTFFYSLSISLSYLSTQSFHSTLSFNDLFSYIFMDGFSFLAAPFFIFFVVIDWSVTAVGGKLPLLLHLFYKLRSTRPDGCKRQGSMFCHFLHRILPYSCPIIIKICKLQSDNRRYK